MRAKLGEVRYRLEGDRACIDIFVQTARQLFDGRDPAPFHDRARLGSGSATLPYRA